MYYKSYVTFTQEKGLCLTENGQHICNFTFTEISLVFKYIDGLYETYIKLKFLFTNGEESDWYEILLSELDKIDWFKINHKCLIDPRCKKAKAHIAYIIQSALSEAKTEKRHILSTPGFYLIDNNPMYLLGDYLIRPPPVNETAPSIEIHSTHKCLIDIEGYSENEAIQEIMKLTRLCPNSVIIFVFQVLNLMRSAYTDAGIPPNFIMFVKGLSGNKKNYYKFNLCKYL